MTGHTQAANNALPATKGARRASAGRFVLNVAALTLMLGIGWVVGGNKFGTADLAQASSTVAAHAVQARASFETAVAQLVSWAGPRDANAIGVEVNPTNSMADAERLSGKLDQLRASSERMLEDGRRA